MNEVFSYQRFEELDGLPLAFYVNAVRKTGTVPESFVSYFKAKVADWNGQRLEVALVLLYELNTAEARHLIADNLGHHLMHIRFTVYAILDRMTPIDDYVLSKIDELRLSPERTKEFGEKEVNRFRDSATKRLAN